MLAKLKIDVKEECVLANALRLFIRESKKYIRTYENEIGDTAVMRAERESIEVCERLLHKISV